jgi:ABC-type multidrug transport system ATPase subunit
MGMKTFIDIESGGFKPGEVMVMMGRQTGKSTLMQHLFEEEAKKTIFATVSSELVDDEQWYTVRTSSPIISRWIRSQNKNWYVEITANYPNYFDVNEKLYVMLELKFK